MFNHNTVYSSFLRDPDEVIVSSYHLDIKGINRGINSGIIITGYQSLFYCKISGFLKALKNSKIITLEHLYNNTFIRTIIIIIFLLEPEIYNRKYINPPIIIGSPSRY